MFDPTSGKLSRALMLVSAVTLMGLTLLRHFCERAPIVAGAR
jgi:hypothetical protein